MIKIHVFHTGRVLVSPELPFGGDDSHLIRSSGFFMKQDEKVWLPVSSYLIEHPKGLFLVDTGWERAIAPNGVLDPKAQKKSLGSSILYHVNQADLPIGQSIKEQLLQLHIHDYNLNGVIITHLDCDHANGLSEVRNAKRFYVSDDEYKYAMKRSSWPRYQKIWWKGIPFQRFQWTSHHGPFEKSFDLLGDGSIQCIAIPGHSDGLCAIKVTNPEGKFVLLYSDGGYASKSWQQMITSGIASDKKQQKQSLAWIKEQSMDPDCIESLANHDSDVIPHTICF